MASTCGGNCGSCGGCGASLTLSAPELRFLEKLGQIPFLPVARKAYDMLPVYLEDDEQPLDVYTKVLVNLEAKGLISIDYDKPLQGLDMADYAAYPVRGSIALTAFGQQVLETVQLQGLQEE